MGSFLFANPTSGSSTSARLMEAEEGLRAAGIAFTRYVVRTPEDVRVCCRAMYEVDDAPLIIVAAGDGTINAVLNCLIPGTATLAVLPLGTSNVLAAELGIRSLADGIRRIERRTVRPFCVGQLQLYDASYRFALMAGIGLDGAVVRDVNDDTKRLLHQGAYAVAAFKNCFSWDADLIEVVTPSQSLDCHTAIVCNGSRYGGDFVLAPEVDLFSPGFVVACIQGRRRRTYLGAALDLLRGKGGSSRFIRRIACQELEIRGHKPIQIDGDFVGYGPARLVAVRDVCSIVI